MAKSGCIHTILFILVFLVLIITSILIFLLSALLFKANYINNLVDYAPTPLMIVSLVAAILQFFLCFYGCICFVRDSSFALYAFCILTAVSILANIGSGYLFFAHDNEMSEEMISKMQRNVNYTSSSDVIMKYWDEVQDRFDCCGPLDYSDWLISGRDNLPKSCCFDPEDAEKSDIDCQVDKVHGGSCISAIESYVSPRLTTMAGILFHGSLLWIVILAFAGGLICDRRLHKKYYQSDIQPLGDSFQGVSVSGLNTQIEFVFTMRSRFKLKPENVYIILVIFIFTFVYFNTIVEKGPTIEVIDPYGEDVCQIKYDQSMTIRDLKKLIRAETGQRIREQRLYHNMEILLNNMTVLESKLEPDDVIIMDEYEDRMIDITVVKLTEDPVNVTFSWSGGIFQFRESMYKIMDEDIIWHDFYHHDRLLNDDMSLFEFGIEHGDTIHIR
ncbi:Tetraspanin-7 [Halotydeus destructor]|nr:Tetraspanin-7 [Halotydeus destructor]